MYINNTNIVVRIKQGCVTLLSRLLLPVTVDETMKKTKKKIKNLTLGYWKMKEIHASELLAETEKR